MEMKYNRALTATLFIALTMPFSVMDNTSKSLYVWDWISNKRSLVGVPKITSETIYPLRFSRRCGV